MTITKRISFGIASLIWLAILASCSSNYIHEEYEDIPSRIWLADSIVSIDFEIENHQQPVDIYYLIQNTAEYPYSNLYVKYFLEDTLGKVLQSNLTGINLFDPKSGKPLGNGLGDVFTLEVPVLRSYQFSQAGTYRFEMQQYMRQDSLPEILSVGIRIQPSK